MSGAAGLAAAKRRRAGPSFVNNELPKKPANLTPNTKNEQSNLINQTVPNNITNSHPLVILAQHEQQLNRLNAEIEDIRENTNSRPILQSSSVDEQSIHFFKGKYEAMSKEMEEMKKVLIKIQTFSMETNLELLKMKRLLKNDHRMKESEEESISSPLENLTINE